MGPHGLQKLLQVYRSSSSTRLAAGGASVLGEHSALVCRAQLRPQGQQNFVRARRSILGAQEARKHHAHPPGLGLLFTAVRHRHASVCGLPLNPQHAAPYPTWQDLPAGPVPLPGPPPRSSQRVLKAQNQITTSSCSTPSPRAWELDPDILPPATHPLEYTQIFLVSRSLWTLIGGADTPLFPVNRMQLFRYLPFSP